MLEEQLSAQTPREGAIPVAAAVERLTDRLAAALDSREPTVFRYPAGTGKSHAFSVVGANEARSGEKLIYSTQEHAVAYETRAKLPPDVKARSVHIHSPLIQVGDEPVCQRAEELSEKVFDFGLSLMGKVCPRCPHRSSCGALQLARERAQALSEASIVFVSHAGISQVVAGDKGLDMKLIVDEMPSAYTELSLSFEEIELVASGEPMPSADNITPRVARAWANWWINGGELGEVKLGSRVIGTVEQLLEDCGGRLKLREGAKPRADEKKLLRAADRVLRIAKHQHDGEVVGGLSNVRGGLWVMEPDACHRALIERQGVLLSATPMMQALPEFRLEEVNVTDSAPVRRVMILRGRRGSTALTKAYYDDDLGQRRVREPEPGEAPGIPWAAVDAALARARKEAERYDCKRILFVTFKTVADSLRSQPARLSDDVVVGHYGALRGKNDWMEGRPLECSVVYCFGTPRFDMRPTLQQLGLLGEAADQAWRDFAAGELAQAEGRLRLPRRTKPCSVCVEGDVAPLTWHADLVTEINEHDDVETPSSLFEGALFTLPLTELREAGIETSPITGLPFGNPEFLRDLARPDINDWIGRLANATPGRRKRHDATFSWIPDNDCEMIDQ